jgi:hypothetical protein
MLDIHISTPPNEKTYISLPKELKNHRRGSGGAKGWESGHLKMQRNPGG